MHVDTPASTTAQSLAVSPSMGSDAGSSTVAPSTGVRFSFIWQTASSKASAYGYRNAATQR